MELPIDKLIREELADPQQLTGHLGRLLDLLGHRLDPERKHLIYILAQYGRIGHLVLEPWMLSGLFGDEYDEIVIVTGPGEKAANPTFFQYLKSRFTIIETDDRVLPAMGFVEGGTFSVDNLDFVLWRPQSLFYRFTSALAAGLPHKFFEPAQEWLEPGRKLRATLLPDADMPYVLMHVRDGAFSPADGYHGFRCNAVETYGSAVEFLLDRGYAVFRIGDQASPKLTVNHPHYIELSHRPYNRLADRRLADFALAAEAHFGIASQSGPWAFFQALGRPILLTNAYPEPYWVFQDHEMALYKHVLREDGTKLTYRELWECEVPDRILTFNRLEENGLKALSNSAEEIRASAEEMLDLLDSQAPPDQDAQARFHAITRMFDNSVKGPAADREIGPRLQRRLSRRFLKFNPHFL